MRKYLVVFEKTKTGFSAYVPDLPGCIATGKNRADVEKRIHDAIQFHLEGLKELNQKIPRANAEGAFLFVNP
jgi:predicted RNase H-like HicB family nuclease